MADDIRRVQVLQNLIPLLAPASPSLPKATALPTSAAELTPLWPLAPALVLCALFFSSTRFTEGISLGKYPAAYGAYRRRVAMFSPTLTPVWGAWLALTGEKAAVDAVVYGVPEKALVGKED